MDVEEIRSYFPITQTGTVYLDHAAKSPASTIVQNAAHKFLEQRAVRDILYWPQGFEDQQQTRGLLGQLIHARPERIGFVSGTTEGLNALVDSLAWRPGDEVVLFRREFPANIFPFLKLQRQHGVAVRVVPDHHLTYRLEDFLAHIGPATRLVTVSCVQFLSGQVADLKLLADACHQAGALLCVDGIQGIGAIPIDVEGWGVDLLASGGHKWLLSVQGFGFVYFSERAQAQMTPARQGWLDRDEPFNLFDWERPQFEDGRRFALGTANDLAIAITAEVLRFRARIGESQISDRLLGLGRYLKHQLHALGCDMLSSPSFRSPIVSFSLDSPERTSHVHAALQRAHMVTSLRGGFLRVSPHVHTTKGDLDRFLEVVRAEV